MPNPFCRCELNAVQSIAGIARVAVALFAWVEKTPVVDPEGLSPGHWPWLLWQLGALIIAFAGVWMLRLSTRRVPWSPGLALGIYTLAIFVNAYTAWFGDHSDAVWLTINPLYIAFGSVAAVALWQCGCAAGRVGALVPVAFGVVVFANAYFVNNGVVWQIMNPLMMLSALTWAAGASKANATGTATTE